MIQLSSSRAGIGAVLVLAGALQALASVLLGSWHNGDPGLAAALGILIAVLAGAIAGWRVGFAVAAVGWAFHFVFVADDSLRALPGLPAWLSAGVAAGWLAARLHASSRERVLLAHELAAVRDSASDAVVRIDADGSIVGWGAGAAAMYGYSIDEVEGRPLFLLMREDAAEGDAQDAVEAIRRGERIERVNEVHRTKDGAELAVSLSMTPLLDELGTPVGAVLVAADVGEQVRVRERLDEVEAKYRSLTKNLPVVTYVYPPGERAAGLDISPQVEALLGYSAREWLAEPGLFARLLHPEDRERVLDEISLAGESTEPLRAEYRMLARDGRVVLVHDEAVTVRNGRGRPLYVQGYLLDVSERRRAQEEKEHLRAGERAAVVEMRDKQRRLDFLAKAATAFASSLDVNTTLRRVAQLAARELADWILVDVLDEDGDAVRLVAAHTAPGAPPGPHPGSEPEPEVLAVIRSGEHELSQSRICVPLVARTRALGAITVVSTTPGRTYGTDDLALVEGLATTAALAIDVARLYREVDERADAARVLAYVADGVFLLDKAGIVQLWNPAAEVIMGLQAPAVLAHPATDAIPGWEALAERIPVRRAPDDSVPAATLPVETERGERWISISGVEFFGGTVYAFRDLTEDRRLEELKADFLSTASHELRTPLAAVYGAAQTLRRHDFALDEAGRDRFISMIVDESERLGRIVNEILLANQLELGRVDLATETFDPAELVERVADAARIHAPPGIELELDAPDLVPPVAADRDKVQQILTNLVENAIKYSPDGGRIELGVEPADRAARFRVCDEGLGVPTEEQARIFDKFYRLDPEMMRGVGGTGLGLYICSELVERMGGQIWIESRETGGSAFFFEIPYGEVPGSRPVQTARQTGDA